MLKLRDLQNRVYSGKQCIKFEVPVAPYDTNNELIAVFARAKCIPENMDAAVYSSCQWEMQILIPRNRDKDTEVYNFSYVMPRMNTPLELVAATGLRYFQLYLKEEIQKKMEMDFALGSILEGM